jgi:hypothetical protein
MTPIEYLPALHPVRHPPSPIFLLEFALTKNSAQHSLEPRHPLIVAAPANCLVFCKARAQLVSQFTNSICVILWPKLINANDIIFLWAHVWSGGAGRRGAVVSAGEAQMLLISLIAVVCWQTIKPFLSRIHFMPMIINLRAAGLRRFWTWASNRRQRVSFIESMILIESPQCTALNATKSSKCKKCDSYLMFYGILNHCRCGTSVRPLGCCMIN